MAESEGSYAASLADDKSLIKHRITRKSRRKEVEKGEEGIKRKVRRRYQGREGRKDE